MSIESITKAQIVEEDPKQMLWKERIKQWALDGTISYEELMKSYPAYTIDEKFKRFLSNILPILK